MKFSVSIKTLMITGIVAVLSACNGGGGAPAAPAGGNNQPLPLTVYTESGGTIELQGIWVSGCIVSGADSYRDTIDVVNSGEITFTTETWIGNTSCTGAVDISSFTVAVDNPGSMSGTTVAGWATLDGWDLTGAILSPAAEPMAADGTRTLAPDATANVIMATVTSISGNPMVDIGNAISVAYVIDDTGALPVLYSVINDGLGSFFGLTNMTLGDINLTPLPVAQLDIVTATGGTLNLVGTWSTGCRLVAGDGMKEVIVVTDTSYEYSSLTWPNDSTCTGTVPGSQIYVTGPITTGTTGMLSTWVDSSFNPALGPLFADGSGTIASDVQYTPIDVTVINSDIDPTLIGNVITVLYVVDDSLPGQELLYFGADTGGAYAYNFAPFSKIAN